MAVFPGPGAPDVEASLPRLQHLPARSARVRPGGAALVQEPARLRPSRYDVELAGCELITNALVHTDSGHGGHVALILDADEHRIRTYVTDDGGSDTQPHANSANDLECSGRGIHLVEALTDDWGTELVEGECRTTWFEIRLNGRRRCR
ncbi:ATP-binding protein [Spirillospora sp. CA-253888]